MMENSREEQVAADRPASLPRSDVPASIHTPINPGDVFSFVYSEESRERAKRGIGHGDLNWCFDGQLVYRDGLLCDTYWGLDWRGDNGRSFTPARALEAGELRYICNLNDVEKIREDEYGLYAEGDAFDLSHQHGCYKHFVKRRGARKNAELMREVLHRKVQSAKDDIDRAVRNLEYAVTHREKTLPLIEAGEEPYI